MKCVAWIVNTQKTLPTQIRLSTVYAVFDKIPARMFRWTIYSSVRRDMIKEFGR